MIRRVLRYIQSIVPSEVIDEDPYTTGYRDALRHIEEYIDDVLWEAGETAEEAEESEDWPA